MKIISGDGFHLSVIKKLDCRLQEIESVNGGVENLTATESIRINNSTRETAASAPAPARGKDSAFNISDIYRVSGS